MDTRVLGVETDPYRSAEEEVALYRDMPPSERYACFLDLMDFMESIIRTRPIEEWRRIWRDLDALDDPGRWWERVPRT